MSRSFVNPHSVQAQFANLNNECESLRHSTTVTNNERRQEENLIKKLLQEQRTLTNQIRIAHTNLGAENKKRQLLEDEMKRLRDILRSDRKHILDITSELLGLKDEEKNRKRKFVEEMNDCNNDLEMGLQSYQNKNFLNMISTKTVKMLIDVILEKELDKEKKQNKENFQASAEVDCLNVSTKWKDLDTRMRESHELIKEASSKMRRELNHRQKLKSDISKLRFKVLKGAESIDDTREALGSTELNELERIWENTKYQPQDGVSTDAPHDPKSPLSGDQEMHESKSNKNEPTNMGLFYGDTDVTQSGLSSGIDA